MPLIAGPACFRALRRRDGSRSMPEDEDIPASWLSVQPRITSDALALQLSTSTKTSSTGSDAGWVAEGHSLTHYLTQT